MSTTTQPTAAQRAAAAIASTIFDAGDVRGNATMAAAIIENALAAERAKAEALAAALDELARVCQHSAGGLGANVAGRRIIAQVAKARAALAAWREEAK